MLQAPGRVLILPEGGEDDLTLDLEDDEGEGGGGGGTLPLQRSPREKQRFSPLSRSPRGDMGGAGREDEDELLPVPIGRSNTLHLSVGGPSDEEDDDDDGCGVSGVNIGRALSEWQRANAPARSPIEGDVMAIPPRADSFYGQEADENFECVLNDILENGQRLFQPISDANFVEEIWTEKKPKVVCGFLFGALIGEGSYAKVKDVVDQQTLVRRAVKIIKDSRLRKIPNGKENVDRELKILRKMRHINVIRLIHTFRDEGKGKLYMFMEYCVASLQQMADNATSKHLSESETHVYFEQLMKGMEYLHAIGVIHKDIKPGNLLMTRDRILKITDFGVAEMLDPFQPSDFMENAQGTPKFMPPEGVGRDVVRYSGFAADIWSCGITLYNLLSSEYPFEAPVIIKLFDAIVHTPLQMPTTTELGCNAQDLLRGMLEKDPSTRWTIPRIRECDWAKRRFNKIEWTPFPPHLDDPPHRPLTVRPALSALFPIDGDDEAMSIDCHGGGEAPVAGPAHIVLPPSESAAPPSMGPRTASADGIAHPVPPVAQPRPPPRTRSFIPACFRRQADSP